VICPSHFAAAEVRELLDVDAVIVAPNGVSETFTRAGAFTMQELARRRLPSKFVLHVGGATKRKNLVSLATAWRDIARQASGVWLLLVGPPDSRRDAAFSGCPRTQMMGYQPVEEVARLMATALAVAVPSRYEGFGLPALEAMAAGTAVVACDAGALPEICGDAAELVPPDPAGIRDGLLRLLSDEIYRADLVLRGRSRAATFPWSRSADRHLDAYRVAFGS
jgi:glycosyltransferase involved in cell wall biosynthesis